MTAPLAKLIDWLALQVWWGARLKLLQALQSGASRPRLEEALSFVRGPEFIPLLPPVAQVEFPSGERGVHFRFCTPYPCDVIENNTVYGRLYRCEDRWRDRPVILLLHGSGDFGNHYFRFPIIARECNRAGFNVATLEAPYHFQRSAPALGEWDYLRSLQTFAQAVAEIRALTGWLLREGCPGVALWGHSYGGWLAGLAICHEPRLAAGVLTVPAAHLSVSLSLGKSCAWRSVRSFLCERATAREALNATCLNLTLNKPVLPRENILLHEALHDLFVGVEPIEQLWQAWGRADIWRFPHGHISLMTQPGLTKRVIEWLSPRLNRARAR